RSRTSSCILPYHSRSPSPSFHFTLTATATTEIYTLSLHDALPIYQGERVPSNRGEAGGTVYLTHTAEQECPFESSPVVVNLKGQDRKSTRLNSSHVKISYAVFCLKKKNRKQDSASIKKESTSENCG